MKDPDVRTQMVAVFFVPLTSVLGLGFLFTHCFLGEKIQGCTRQLVVRLIFAVQLFYAAVFAYLWNSHDCPEHLRYDSDQFIFGSASFFVVSSLVFLVTARDHSKPTLLQFLLYCTGIYWLGLTAQLVVLRVM